MGVAGTLLIGLTVAMLCAVARAAALPSTLRIMRLWVRLYTLGADPLARQMQLEDKEAYYQAYIDLHGKDPSAQIALLVLGSLLKGIPGDLFWRSAWQEELANEVALHASERVFKALPRKEAVWITDNQQFRLATEEIRRVTHAKCRVGLHSITAEGHLVFLAAKRKGIFLHHIQPLVMSVEAGCDDDWQKLLKAASEILANRLHS
jgi:hypothetical protein